MSFGGARELLRWLETVGWVEDWMECSIVSVFCSCREVVAVEVEVEENEKQKKCAVGACL